MGGRVTASAIASASRLSFLFDLTYGFTHGGAISLTSWPWVRKRRAQSCAPPQASMPRRTGGSVAIQGIRSCRDTRLRYTTLPLSSLPTAGNTRLAISIPRTYISCFIGLASCGSRGSRIVNALGLIAVDPHRGGSISLRPRNGSVTYSHQMLGAAIIHPDFREVIPLMPEPIVKQDGTTKHDCERNAAKRFITKLRQDHPHLKFIMTEDALSSNAPHIETLHDSGCHYILGVKEGDHTYLFQQVEAADEAGGVSYYERHDRAAGLLHRFRFVNDMPLNGSRKDVRVNFIEYWEVGQAQVQHFSWVTDLRVNRRNVYKLMRGGRARWKIENETFNTLKNQGYNFEHNYGHGEKNLSVVFAMLMMLAFLVDQTQQLCCALFRAVWAKFGSKRLLWERMRALFYDYRLDSMRELLEALYVGFAKSHPMILTDSS